MPSEVLSTARPTALRFAGFLCVAAGGLLAGLGAVRDWAVIGFPGDTAGNLDVAVKGIDVWEGLVVLAASAAVLIGLLAMRLISSRRARSAIAMTILALGVLIAGLALSTAARVESRFGGAEGLQDIANSVSKQLDLPADTVLAELEQQFGAQLRVDLGIGIWLSAVGGALVAIGGGLSLAWARRSGGTDPREPDATADGSTAAEAEPTSD